MSVTTTPGKVFSSYSMIVVFVVFMIIGMACIPALNISYLPGHSLPRLIVSFAWPDASPALIDMESSKIEGTLSRISGIKSIESVSSQGSGIISLEMDKNVDIHRKRYEVSTLIRQLRNNLPVEMSYPEIHVDSDDEEDVYADFMVLSLTGNASSFQIGKTAEKYVIPRLLKIPGIADITLTGVTPYQWEIGFDDQQLENMRISPEKIREAIRQLNNRSFLGTITHSSGVSLPVLSSFTSIQPGCIGKIPIARTNGRIISIDDVADISFREKKPLAYFRINGKNTVNLVILSDDGQNQIKLADKIKRQLPGIRSLLPDQYHLKITSDHTGFIRSELQKIGIRSVFSLMILLLFVLIANKSFRILLILVISLIANFLISCVFYYIFQIGIHLYSLAGISISFGIIIDNSIVMISHLRSHKGLRIFVSLLAATLTTIGALSMVFFLKTHQKIMLIDFSRVVLINLTVSLLISLFFIPALMNKLNKGKYNTKGSFKLRRIIVHIYSIYLRIIVTGKRHKWAMIALMILTFGLPSHLIPDGKENTSSTGTFNQLLQSTSFQLVIRPFLVKLLGGSLRLFSEYVYTGNVYADPGETSLIVRGGMPLGGTIDQLNNAVQKLEEYISQFSDIAQFETRITGYDNAVIYIQFRHEVQKTSFPHILMDKLKTKIVSIGGVEWSVYGVGQGFTNFSPSGTKTFNIELKGYQYNPLYTYAEQLEKNLQLHPRVEKTEINSYMSWDTEMLNEYRLTVDNSALSVYDLSFSGFTLALFNRLYRRDLPSLYNESQHEKVVLFNRNSHSFDQWSFYHRPFYTPQGMKKLTQAGKIVNTQTGRSIYRKDQVYRIYVNFDYLGLPVFGDKILQQEIDKINQTMTIGYQAVEPEFPGYWDQKDKNQYVVLGLIILIIWLITAILFNSLIQPFIVILLIPISFTGVFLTFYLFDLNFDQGGYASFVLLSGLVVNAAIFIINDYNQLAQIYRGRKPLNIYVKAFNRKIIPVLLTVSSTVLGLVPFMWSGQKEVFWFAFAAGSSGGLLFSLVAIVFCLPLFIPVFQKNSKNSKSQAMRKPFTSVL